MFRNFGLLLIALIMVATNVVGKSINSICSTPNNIAGVCIPLAECKSLFEVLKPNITSDDRAFLQKSQCGFAGTNKDPAHEILVCCASGNSVEDSKTEPGNVLPQTGICGLSFRDKIYGGKMTNLDEFPWMALIQYLKPNKNIEFICGGSLINTRYIITAAHCVLKVPSTWKLHSVRLGEWDLDSDPDCEVNLNGRKDCALNHIDVLTESFIAHPLYDPNSTNKFHDLALIRLAKPVIYTDFVKPICLPIADELCNSVFPNTVMDVAGWGITERLDISRYKLKIEVNVWEIQRCQAKYKSEHIDINGTHQLCAGGVLGKDTCSGDSGGPLMVPESIGGRDIYFIAGVVAKGASPCAQEDWPGVYTRIGYYVDWIVSVLKP